MIAVEHLTKKFKLYKSPADRLKEIILHRSFHRDYTALNDVSFTVGEGEVLGIVGQNGAGKSTLLKLLMGILLPDGGTIGIDGRITGLLELTTGFNAEFTGMQNIYFNGALRGMSRQEIDQKIEQIAAFSELDDFIREPIKTYSSGMVMRLAFSIAIHAEPQAFVVDEALSVGDAYFQQKCIKRIKDFKKKGGAIIFVSHDLNAIKILSDRAMLLDHGQVVAAGEPDSVINTYNFLLARKSEGQELTVRPAVDKGRSYGNFKVEINAVRLLDAGGQESEIFISGHQCIIQTLLRAQEEVPEITVGILIRDRFGQDIFGTNSYYLNKPLSLVPGKTYVVQYSIDELNIGPGTYTVTVAAHTQETHLDECYHWADRIRHFEIVGSHDFKFIGISRLKPVIEVHPVD